MDIVIAKNVNHALAKGLRLLNHQGEFQDSRNGAVLVNPQPVVTKYLRPDQRVMFSPIRDANPFFHLMEALWMMAGRSDVAWPIFFNSRFGEYSDDGLELAGAYGNRWRNWFGYDQILRIVEELRANRDSRRCVLAMWDASSDLGKVSSDIPCNTQIYFRINHNRLDMTVTCRSNDIYWGAYGANAVHMSVLHEFMAAATGVSLGTYFQVSNNYHLYTGVEALASESSREVMAEWAAQSDAYTTGDVLVEPFPLVTRPVMDWMNDLNDFMAAPLQPTLFMDPFLRYTAIPMFTAWWNRKNKINDGLADAKTIAASDWRKACTEWIERRM